MGEREKLAVKHQEASLDDVLDYYVDGFKKSGATIENYEAFVDTAKRRVVFRLYVREVQP